MNGYNGKYFRDNDWSGSVTSLPRPHSGAGFKTTSTGILWPKTCAETDSMLAIREYSVPITQENAGSPRSGVSLPLHHHHHSPSLRTARLLHDQPTTLVIRRGSRAAATTNPPPLDTLIGGLFGFKQPPREMVEDLVERFGEITWRDGQAFLETRAPALYQRVTFMFFLWIGSITATLLALAVAYLVIFAASTFSAHLDWTSILGGRPLLLTTTMLRSAHAQIAYTLVQIIHSYLHVHMLVLAGSILGSVALSYINGAVFVFRLFFARLTRSTR